jgi:hypothetical protein
MNVVEYALCISAGLLAVMVVKGLQYMCEVIDMNKIYTKNQIRFYFFLALLLLVVPSMFALNWGVVNLVNLQLMGDVNLGVACCAVAIFTAGLMLAYFAKIALRLNRMLKTHKYDTP